MKEPLSDRMIKTLHYLLSEGLVPQQYAGRVRDQVVRISGSTYLPLESPIALNNELLAIVKKASLINDPFEQSFFLLVHISYLQAFIDVNKRTARLSCNIPLIRMNCIPLSFNNIDKNAYLSAVICVYELKKIEPLRDMYLYSYTNTSKQYKATADSMGIDEIRVRYRDTRRAMISHIIKNLFNKEAIENYIHREAISLIPSKARENFIEDIYEDLIDIDTNRIAVLGISQQDLKKWQSKKIKF